MQKWNKIASVLAPAVLLATSTLLAQVPATQPVAPGGAPVDPFANKRTPTTQISLNFKDAPIDSVLDSLSSLAGFVVVKEAPLTGRVTVLSKQPVSPEEAVSLLNAVLKTNGYTAIQNGRILTITTRDKAKKANVPVHFGSDPTVIEQSETIITQVIPLRNVDAVKLRKDLDTLIGKDADVTSNAGSNTLIVTDTSANVYRIVNIIAKIDSREAADSTIMVKQLQYADAVSAAKLINDIFKPEDSNDNAANSGPGAFFRAMQRGGGGGGGGTTEEDKGRAGKVITSSDARTNTVVVTGPVDTIKVIEEMLTKLDANPASEQAFFLYNLKNGQAANMAATLNTLFGNSTSGTNNTSNTRSGNRTTSSFGSSNTSSRSGSSGNSRTSSSNSRGGNTQSSNSQNTANQSGRGFNQGAQVTPAVSAAASTLAGEVTVVADADTNSLLVSTASKYEKQVRDIIEQLDRPVPQVLIKVLIAEVSHNNSNDFGVDFSILNTRASGNGVTAGTVFGAPTNGLIVSVLEKDVTATLHALATAGRLDVLSRPYILASDNQLASITVGQTVPVITSSNLDVNNNPVNQIQYQDIGIILNVTPHINPEGLVIMDVSPSVSSFSDQTVPISSTVNAPVFNLRSADSRVGIKDGETIVIGGMMEDRKTQTVSKVPLLGEIPLIGLMFQRNQTQKTKTELLFFLTPHVAKAPDLLKPMSDDERGGLRLVPGAVQPGTFQEHLDGLNRGGGQPTAPVQPDKPGNGGTRVPEPPLPGTK